MVVNTTKRQSSRTAQSWEVMGRMGLFSAPGSVLIKTTLLKSLQFVVGTQTLMLSKQWLLADNNGCSDDRISGKPMVISYCKQHNLGEEVSVCMASAFLENVVPLQW